MMSIPQKKFIKMAQYKNDESDKEHRVTFSDTFNLTNLSPKEQPDKYGSSPMSRTQLK